jgi:hypothetical protein
MLLPFTAGTFLYVGTVAVIPELLETGKDKGAEIRKTIAQFAAIAAGAGIMLWYVVFPSWKSALLMSFCQDLVVLIEFQEGHLPYRCVILNINSRHVLLASIRHTTIESKLHPLCLTPSS